MSISLRICHSPSFSSEICHWSEDGRCCGQFVALLRALHPGKQMVDEALKGEAVSCSEDAITVAHQAEGVDSVEGSVLGLGISGGATLRSSGYGGST